MPNKDYHQRHKLSHWSFLIREITIFQTCSLPRWSFHLFGKVAFGGTRPPEHLILTADGLQQRTFCWEVV